MFKLLTFFGIPQLRIRPLVILFVFSLMWSAGRNLVFAERHVFNEIAVDYPLDGGGMVMASRLWSLNRFVRVGFVVGGGVIKRDFDFTASNGEKLEAETSSIVLPFIGPRVSFFYKFFGLSLAFGGFHAKTDFDLKGPSLGSASGEKTGWGTGLYSPLLVLDFYDKKHNILFGLGLGGFLGNSYPDLEASNATTRVITDESPLDTITVHFRMAWSAKRGKEKSYDDYFNGEF
ncbi:hypothetical protein BVX98_01905 [bacterium F11]|nr:hypothetical protein BVX98_01905 [bacterium F11]